MSRFDDLIALGLARVKSNAGVTVTLRRGVLTTTATAIVGQTISEPLDSDAQRLRIRERDYLIDAEDYAFESTAAEPMAGDEIDQTIDGAVATFEVNGRRGETPWEWSDGNRTRYRIHTREIYASG